MDPSSIYNAPELQQARSAYEGASKRAQEASSAASTLPDMLREALTKKFSTDNPQVQARESALKNYLSATTGAPLAVTAQSAGGSAPVIYDPLQQANLIQGRRSAALAPLSTANYLLGLTTGGIEDVIGSTARAYQGQVEGLQNQAQAARGSYQDLLSELSQRAEAAFRQQQYEDQKRPQGGGGSGGTGVPDLLGALLTAFTGGQEQSYQPTEPKPISYPSSKKDLFGRTRKKEIGLYTSPGGQWYYDKQGGDWVPITD